MTNKPVLAVVNLGEDQVAEADELTKPVAAELGDVAEVLGVSVQLGRRPRRWRRPTGPSCWRGWGSRKPGETTT